MRDADASVGLAIRKYRRGLPLLTACGLALGLRLYALGRYPLDGDEIFSIRASAATWGNVISIAINDKSHPPLFYAILKLWLLLVPAKEIWARLPSVLFGTALIPVTFGICRKLRLAEADTVLVILVIAVNSELIFYAQQARMFPLFELSSALSILAFIYFLESWVSWRLLALLSLVNLLMVYSHYWGWLAIGAQLLCVLLGHRAKVGGFLWSSAIVAVGFAPWALGVTTAGVDHGAVMRQIAWMGADIAGSRDYAELLGEIDGPIDFKHATSLGIVLFLGPPTVIFLRQVRRGTPPPFDTRGIGLWGLLAGIPVVLNSFGSYLAHQSFWGTRHLTMIIVPYFVMVGLSLTELSAPFAKQVLRCLILAWAVTASTLSLAEINKEIYWEIIAKEIASADRVPVYATEPFVKGPLEYHFQNSAATAIAVNEQSDLSRITEERFWFVYRDISWRGEAPEIQLVARGDSIEHRLTVRSERSGRERQAITALLVRRAQSN